MAGSSLSAVLGLMEGLKGGKPLEVQVSADMGDLMNFSSAETVRGGKEVRFQGTTERKSKTPKPERPKTTASALGKSLYNRGQAFLLKRAEKVEAWKQHEFSFKPSINPKSAEITQRTVRSPLHQAKPKTPPPPEPIPMPVAKPERLNLSAFLDRNYTKQLAVLSARKEPRAEPIEKECTFHPSVNGKSSELASKRKESLYEREMKSQADLHKRLEALVKSKEEMAMRECTFTPRHK